jgi:hypothetical protein
MMWLLNLVNPLKVIGDQLNRAYQTKMLAVTDKERIEADKEISNLEARRDVLLAEQGSWMTRWIRPALALPVAIFWFKLLVWDTVLGWGSTPYPGEHVMWYAMLIPTAYFLVRPVEKFSRRRT